MTTPRRATSWARAGRRRADRLRPGKGGDENYRLYAVGRDGSNPLDLTPFEGVKCDIVDDLEDEPDGILFRMNRRERGLRRLPSNVATGEMRCVAENPGNVQRWLTDRPAACGAATPRTASRRACSSARRRRTRGGRSGPTTSTRRSSPLRFTFDDQRLFVPSNVGRDRAAIFEYDPTTGGQGRWSSSTPRSTAGSPLAAPPGLPAWPTRPGSRSGASSTRGAAPSASSTRSCPGA